MNRGWRGRGGRHPRGNQQRGRGGFRGGRGASGFPCGGVHHGHDADPRGGHGDRPPQSERPHHGASKDRTDFQVPGPSNQEPQHLPQDVKGGFSQWSSEQDIPDYEWPPPDYQWPPGDDPASEQRGFDVPPGSVSPHHDQSVRDDHRAREETLPHEQIDMFQTGPPERLPRQSPGQDRDGRGHGGRRSLSPRRDTANHPPLDEGIARGRQELHMDQQFGSGLKDSESIRITVGNEHFFSSRGPAGQDAQRPSALDRLGPMADRPPINTQDYGHQRQSSLEREQRYMERPAEPDAEHMCRSRSSSLEKPRFGSSSPSTQDSRAYEEMAASMIAGTMNRDNSKEREMDYEHRSSRHERGREEGRDIGERGHYRSHQDDQRKEKDRGRERGRETDRNWRDEKPKDAARPRDPRRDKDFLAERSKKPPSPLPPSDVPPLYHFLGKNESKKGSEKDDTKKRAASQRPGIPMPTKSRHATSSASSPVGQAKPIESAPDVVEPPKALKSILKKSILKKPKVPLEESKVAQEAPVQESPQITHQQSPTTALRRSPVTVQRQPSQTLQEEQMPGPPLLIESPVPLQPESFPVCSQPEQMPLAPQREILPMSTQPQHTPEVQQHTPEVQQPTQLYEPPKSMPEIPTSAGPPPGISTENINNLLSSLSGLYQGAVSASQFVSQSENTRYQQQVSQQAQQQMQQQQMQQPVQQSVQHPLQPTQNTTVFGLAQPQVQNPQQLYPASSQQVHPGMFQQASPAVSEQMFPTVSQHTQHASFQQTNPEVSQVFPTFTHQMHPIMSEATRPMAPQQVYPAVSQQLHPAVSQQTYPSVLQQSSAAPLALDEATASKIRDLAQSLGQVISSTTSQSSIPKLFPSGDPEARSNSLSQIHGQPDVETHTGSESVQAKVQTQNVPYSTSTDRGILGHQQSNQPNPYIAQSVQKQPEPVPSYTGFVSLDDEDRFLYGDADEEEKHKQPEKASSRVDHPSKADTLQTTTKVEVPSEDQIKNILSAIGFDFSLAQKIKEQKEQKEQRKGNKESKTNKPEAVAKTGAAQEPSERKIPEPLQATAAPVSEDNLTGLNKTASFLDSGIKIKTDKELDDFIRDAKKNVSKHKRKASENRDQTSGSSGSHSVSRSTERHDDPQETVKIQTQIGSHKGRQSSTEGGYIKEPVDVLTHSEYGQYPSEEAVSQPPQELKYQDGGTYNNPAYQSSQPQEGYYQGMQGQHQAHVGVHQQSQQYPPIEQTVQFVGSSHDSFPLSGPNVAMDAQSFQPENIFISVNTAGDSSSGSNRVVLLPKSDPVMDERQRRILEIERRYQQGRDASEVKQIVETERERERRLRREAEELIEKEKQRRREERKRKEDEERKRKGEEERKQKEEERKKKEEERKKRDEERRRKEEEEKRKKDAEREKDREFEMLLEGDPSMKVDIETFRNKINSLETELEKLCKKHAEIKRQTYLTSGHKDSLLSENNELQDKICNQLRALRRKMNQYREEAEKNKESGSERSRERSHERSRSRSQERRPSRDSSKSSRSERSSRDSKERATARESSKDSSKTGSKDRESSKGSKDKKTENRQDVKARVDRVEESSDKSDKLLRFEFNYYDPGDHWCKLCNIQSGTLNELFIHLHAKMHAKNCDPYDRPWMQDTLSKAKKKAANTIDAPIRGTEFVMPVNGFFCRLCKEFFGDGLCATEHLKTSKHNRTYEKFLEENTYYEKRLKIERAAGRAQKLKMAVNQEREQKRKMDEDDEGDENSEVQSKKAKVEEQDIKMVGTKGQRGFGVFDFNKNEEEKEDVKIKPESESTPQSESKPERALPPDTKPPKAVPPPPTSDPIASLTPAEKKAALAAKIAPMVGKMRGPSSKFLLRKTATPKLPQTSKLVTQNVFTDASKKSLTFDTLPVVKDKAEDVKKNLQALKMTQSDIANAFGGKSIQEEPQPVKPKVQPSLVSSPIPNVNQKDSVKNRAAQTKEKPQVKQEARVMPKVKETSMFGPALPPSKMVYPPAPPLPKRVSLEDMDEEDVCVPGMDDDLPNLPDFLPKPKPPPPVTIGSTAPTPASASACASSTATNLYNIFYKPDD